jgi:hypothetical protein
MVLTTNIIRPTGTIMAKIIRQPKNNCPPPSESKVIVQRRDAKDTEGKFNLLISIMIRSFDFPEGIRFFPLRSLSLR